MKQFTGKYSKPSSFLSQLKIYIAQEKVKTFKETVSFHLASNHSNFLNHMIVLPRFLYSRFTSQSLTLLIMPVGITVKSSPEYWPITVNVTYLQALAI